MEALTCHKIGEFIETANHWKTHLHSDVTGPVPIQPNAPQASVRTASNIVIKTVSDIRAAVRLDTEPRA